MYLFTPCWFNLYNCCCHERKHWFDYYWANGKGHLNWKHWYRLLQVSSTQQDFLTVGTSMKNLFVFNHEPPLLALMWSFRDGAEGQIENSPPFKNPSGITAFILHPSRNASHLLNVEILITSRAVLCSLSLSLCLWKHHLSYE